MPLRLFVLLMLTASPALGQEVHANDKQPVCDKPPCIFVHVDAVSYWDSHTQDKSGLKAPVIKNVIVSNDQQGTYVLECYPFAPWDRVCTPPTINAKYEFIYSGEKWATTGKHIFGGLPDEKDVFLRAGEFVGTYELAAHVPTTAGSETPHLIAKCIAANRNLFGYDETNCAKWLNRKEEARKAACPDAAAAVAWHSFQELLAADDYMGDFSQKNRAFTCFREHDDVFFNLWFSEPEAPGWQQEDERAPIFTHFGSAAFDYYKQGVWDFNLSVGGTGKWRYLFPRSCDYNCKAEANSSNSEYEFHNDAGGSIRINGNGWNDQAVLTESYSNKAGTRTTHEVIVQLSTGRFIERYTWPKSNGIDETEESTGRCLVLTPLSSQQ